MTAYARDADGNLARSDNVMIQVVTDASLINITANPDVLNLLNFSPTLRMNIMGVYEDGVERKISSSEYGTAYDIADPSIATVDAEGFVTALSVGTTIITATNGELMAESEIVVHSVPQLVSVPNLFGLSLVNAEAAITTADLILGTKSPAISGNEQYDVVFSQHPVAGTQVPVGSSIDLEFSVVIIEPPTVPDIVGMEQSSAESVILANNLTVGTVTTQYNDTVQSGHVISQSPDSGTIVTAGTLVNLVVSLGSEMVEVPNVVNFSLSDALSAIEAAGLTVVDIAIIVFSDTVPEGHVILQGPVAGTSVTLGTSVFLTVSAGPAVLVPDVVGMLLDDAESAIVNAGLIVGTIHTQHSNTVAIDNVISQNPVKDTEVEAGSGVDMVVSSGSCVDLDSGLLAYWTFDNCDAMDITGNGYDGAMSGGPACVEGVIGNALDFDAVNDHIKLNKTINPNEMKALSFWINSRGVDGVNELGTVIAKYSWHGRRSFLVDTFDIAVNRIRTTLYSDGVSYNSDRLSSYYEDPASLDPEIFTLYDNSELEINKWKHVVVNITETEVEIWIDGTLVSKKSRDSQQYFNSSEPTYIGNAFLIGSDFVYNYRLNGVLDDFRIYSRPLSAEDIQLLGHLDSDCDGVTDDKDLCPETPGGVIVDDKGCPEGIAMLFLESEDQAGRFVIEAEDFSLRQSSDNTEWLIIPEESEGYPSQFANFRGDGYIQALPDVNGGSAPLQEPYVDYKICVNTSGTYRLYARWD
ncbi:MAG: PASTA domain-containing protein, partial [Candidatus Thorarchaeota archaeon]